MRTINILLGAMLLSLASSQHNIVFNQIGHLATDTTSYLLIGQLDLSSTINQTPLLTSVGEHIKEAFHQLPDNRVTEKTLIQNQVRQLHDHLKEVGSQLADLKSLTHLNSTRERRSIMLVAGLAAIGTSLSSLWYNHHLTQRLDKLQDQQSDLLHYVDVATKQVQENRVRIDTLNSTLYQLVAHQLQYEAGVTQSLQETIQIQRIIMTLDSCYKALQDYERAIRNTIEIVSDSLQGKISLQLMHPSAVEAELHKIEKLLPEDLRLAFSPKDFGAFFSLPCLTSIRGTTLRIAIAIPVYNSKTTLRLYRHVQTPVISKDGLDILLQAENNVLAINEEQTLHSQFHDSELASCTQVHDIFLCPAHRVLKKANQLACLPLLFQGKTEEAINHCEHRLRVSLRMEIVQVTTNTFLITATDNSNLQQSCEEPGKSRMIRIPPGYTKVQVPSGCSLSSEHYFVTPARNSTIGVDNWTISVPVLNMEAALSAFGQRYPDLNFGSEELKQVISSLTKFSSTTTPNEIRRERPHLASDATSVTILSSAIISCLCATTLAVCVGYLYCRFRCNQRQQQVRHNICRKCSGRTDSSRGGLCNGNATEMTPKMPRSTDEEEPMEID